MSVERGSIIVRHPHWLERVIDRHREINSDDEAMGIVLMLTRENLKHGGGPYASIVLERNRSNEGSPRRLVGVGVNLVVPASNSIAHAPVVAIMDANVQLQRWSLADDAKLFYELVTTAEPCGLCGHAILCGGISRVVYGARAKTSHRIGMERGMETMAFLREHSISIQSDVRLKEATELLLDYERSRGTPYNPSTS